MLGASPVPGRTGRGEATLLTSPGDTSLLNNRGIQVKYITFQAFSMGSEAFFQPLVVSFLVLAIFPTFKGHQRDYRSIWMCSLIRFYLHGCGGKVSFEDILRVLFTGVAGASIMYGAMGFGAPDRFIEVLL